MTARTPWRMVAAWRSPQDAGYSSKDLEEAIVVVAVALVTGQDTDDDAVRDENGAQVKFERHLTRWLSLGMQIVQD